MCDADGGRGKAEQSPVGLIRGQDHNIMLSIIARQICGSLSEAPCCNLGENSGDGRLFPAPFQYLSCC